MMMNKNKNLNENVVFHCYLDCYCIVEFECECVHTTECNAMTLTAL